MVVASLLAGLAVGGASTIGVAERAYLVGLSAGWYNAAWAFGAVSGLILILAADAIVERCRQEIRKLLPLAASLTITPVRTVRGRAISGTLSVTSARTIAKTTVSGALTAPLTLALAVAVLIPILLA